MCATSALVAFLCVLLPPAATAPWAPRLDHDLFQPAALRAAAARDAAGGDAGTALILRARAETIEGRSRPMAEKREAGAPGAAPLPALWPAR